MHHVFYKGVNLKLRLGIFAGFALCLTGVLSRPAAAYVEITSGNDTLDDTTTIMNALAAARNANTYVLARAGTYYHSGVLTIDSVELRGEGDITIIKASDPANAALRLTGTAPKLASLKVQSSYSGPVVANSPDRLQSNASAAVLSENSTNFAITNVTVRGGRSAGILINNSAGVSSAFAPISGTQVSDTLADGIHITNKSKYILVQGNTVTNSQDDKIAVVSYVSNGGVCNNIGINSNVVGGGDWGRGIAVVGGDHLSVTNNTITNSSHSGIYLVSEGSYNTYGDSAITVSNNTVQDCNVPPISGQAGIIVSGRTGYIATNIAFTGNRILNCGGHGVYINNAQTATFTNTTIDGATQCGMSIFSSKDVTIQSTIPGVSSIKNTGQNGIYADATCSGFLKILSNKFEQINKTGESWRDVIFVGNGPTLTATITGNDYQNPSLNPINRYIECQSSYTTPISPANTRGTAITSSPSIFCP